MIRTSSSSTIPRLLAMVIMVLGMGALSACGPLLGNKLDAISYYTLTPTATQESATSPTGGGIIAVQRVRIPEYLNQREIVVRSQATEVQLADSSQWAGSLGDNITNVIAGNLAAQLASTRVVTFPVNPALPLDRVVQVDIAQFDGDSNGAVILEAQWLIFADGGRKFLTTDGRRYTVQAADGSLPALVRAMSDALGQLSRDIGDDLAGLRGDGKRGS